MVVMLKKFKKAVSMVAALAVVFSAMIVPMGTVSAAEGSTKVSCGAWTNVVNENFSSYTDVSGVTSAGWTISDKNASDGFTDSPVAEIGTPVTGNNAIGILCSQASSYYMTKTLDNVITTGQVKVTMAVKPASATKTVIHLMKSSEDNSGTDVVIFDETGVLRNASWANLGSYTAGKWYTISVMLDLDNDKMDCMVVQMTDDLSGVGAQPINISKTVATDFVFGKIRIS